MYSSLGNSLFTFKHYLEEKGMLVHWQYLVLASGLSFFGGLLWAFIGISYNMELSFIAAFLGFIQGFLAFIYMRQKGEPRLIFYTIIFSFSSFFLGKYLLYVHNFDWVLSGVVDKSELTFSLLFFYLRAISYASINDFIIFFRETYDLYDVLWIILLLASGLEYQVFYNSDEANRRGSPPRRGSGRRIHRRFTGQQF